MGTGQGSVISPLLASVYLHYVFDPWAHKGDMIFVRYADELVVRFEQEADADASGSARFETFTLSLHLYKTRQIEFGRYYVQFGPGYTLLQLDPSAATTVSDIQSASDDAGIPLDIVDLSDENLGDLFGAHVVLIQPDQHVAWRGSVIANEASKLIATICGTQKTAKVSKKQKL